MPTVSVNEVSLYYEEAGQGTPLVFSHEFAGDGRSWEPQLRYFSRYYRCITYNARGYPPSSVPTDPEAYSEELAVEDLHQLIRELDAAQAHVVGLSMGGTSTLKLGLRHPEVCRSLVVAGAGSGSTIPGQFQREAEAVAERYEHEGAEKTAEVYSHGPGRLRFMQKDPRGWQEFSRALAQHSALGAALTQRGVQARRKSIFEIESELPSLRLPALIIVGDEDELCLEPGLLMKRRIPNAGLAIFPKSGHTLNLEEPALFNQTVLDFLVAVEENRWLPRLETAQSLLPAEARPG